MQKLKFGKVTELGKGEIDVEPNHRSPRAYIHNHHNVISVCLPPKFQSKQHLHKAMFSSCTRLR
jgi:hypothetical protein